MYLISALFYLPTIVCSSLTTYAPSSILPMNLSIANKWKSIYIFCLSFYFPSSFSCYLRGRRKKVYGLAGQLAIFLPRLALYITPAKWDHEYPSNTVTEEEEDALRRRTALTLSLPLPLSLTLRPTALCLSLPHNRMMEGYSKGEKNVRILPNRLLFNNKYTP